MPVCFVLHSLSPTLKVAYGFQSGDAKSFAPITVTINAPGSFVAPVGPSMGNAATPGFSASLPAPTGLLAWPVDTGSAGSGRASKPSPLCLCPFLKTESTLLPALPGKPPICVNARPVVVNVDVFFLDLAIIAGWKTRRTRTCPFWPCFSVKSATFCSFISNGSTFERSILPTPRLLACSIWFQSNSSTVKSAPTREGTVTSKDSFHSGLSVFFFVSDLKTLEPLREKTA